MFESLVKTNVNVAMPVKQRYTRMSAQGGCSLFTVVLVLLLGCCVCI